LIVSQSLAEMSREAARRLEPNRLAAYAFTQLAPLGRLPRSVGHVISQLERGTLSVGVVPTGLDELEHNLRSIANRIGAAMIIGALLLASSLLVNANKVEWLGVAGFCLAGVLGLYMVWKIIRTPGEL
jgi:hypothetical protein